MPGDSQSRESVHQPRVCIQAFHAENTPAIKYQIVVWRQSRDIVGNLPSVKGERAAS